MRSVLDACRANLRPFVAEIRLEVLVRCPIERALDTLTMLHDEYHYCDACRIVFEWFT
jgi:hypothetical protein